VGKHILKDEIKFRNKLSKSLTTVVDVAKGETITDKMLECKCPGTGISPMMIRDVIGRMAAHSIPAGVTLKHDDIVWDKNIPPNKETLAPFNQSAACPKCQWKSVDIKYHGNTGASYQPCRDVTGEHFDRKCNQCSYEWQESISPGR
jgi:hypothetical protein